MEHLTIKENKQFNGIELYFDTIPNKETITALKNQKFRWHSTKKCWFAKATDSNKDFVNALIKNDTDAQFLTENSQKRYNSTTEKSELKYLLNGIKDKNGKYFACYYGFDNLTLEICVHHKSYGNLPTPTNATGITYQDDSDIMTDYFCKPSLYIAPTSAEYTEAFATLKKVKEKNKGYFGFDLNKKALEQIEKVLTADENEKENIYNKIVEQNEKEQQAEAEKQKIEDTKNYISKLQEEKEKIENGKYSYYEKIIENNDSITAITKNEYCLIDFTPNCMENKKIDYTIIKINKKDYSREKSQTLNIQQYNEYLKTIEA